jgi:DNA (cytosine-5)-methyltransferase 3A
MNGLNVFSSFDGISCGQVALERANILVSNYFACEIKKSAIKVTQNNYPNTIQVGDIEKIDASYLPKIDLLLGGSPCQNLSRARTSHCNIVDGLNGNKSRLFFEYCRIFKETKPKYFLLENVVMPEKDEKLISELLNTKPIKINSNLVSYQNRNRLYWTNIPIKEKLIDKNINFQDFKDTDFDYCKKFKANRTPSREKMWGNGINGKCPNVTHRKKINCLTLKQDRWKNSGLIEFDGFCRYLTTKELELAQNLPIGYTKGISKNQAENVLGDCWTVDVIVYILQGLKP